MSNQRPLTFLCLSSYFKGVEFIKTSKALGHEIILVTKESLADRPWPREDIDEFFKMPDLIEQPNITHAVSYLARSRKIDAIIPLDEYDIGTTASLREHLRIPGMGETTSRYFRDKLAMRVRAKEEGLAVPAFVPVINYDTLREYMERVSPPWLLKPRSEAAAVGIKKIDHSEALWRALDEMGDKQSFYVLEQFVPGEVYHVDAIITNRQVVFAVAHKYGRPPMNIAHEGGVFITSTMDHDSEETQALLTMNSQLIRAFGLVRGVTHAEFIRGADGQIYFLEIAARVGGANIDQLVQSATGINLWSEWAKVETAYLHQQAYQLPEYRKAYAGLALCLAKQPHPDLSSYNDPEIVWRFQEKEHHAGLIVVSKERQRVQTLLDSYSERFAHDFLAVEPVPDEPLD